MRTPPTPVRIAVSRVKHYNHVVCLTRIVLAFESSFLSFCPRICAGEECLTATTSWLFRIMTLGLALRRVVIDRQTQTITLERRTGWFFLRRSTYSFREIQSVTYGYEDVAFSSSLSRTHDSVDRFVVGLRPVGREEVRLFYFFGDGTFTNEGGLPDWWYWEDYLADWSGTQQSESRLFVQLLSKMIGVTITPSTLTSEPL